MGKTTVEHYEMARANARRQYEEHYPRPPHYDVVDNRWQRQAWLFVAVSTSLVSAVRTLFTFYAGSVDFIEANNIVAGKELAAMASILSTSFIEFALFLIASSMAADFLRTAEKQEREKRARGEGAGGRSVNDNILALLNVISLCVVMVMALVGNLTVTWNGLGDATPILIGIAPPIIGFLAGWKHATLVFENTTVERRTKLSNQKIDTQYNVGFENWFKDNSRGFLAIAKNTVEDDNQRRLEDSLRTQQLLEYAQYPSPALTAARPEPVLSTDELVLSWCEDNPDWALTISSRQLAEELDGAISNVTANKYLKQWRQAQPVSEEVAVDTESNNEG